MLNILHGHLHCCQQQHSHNQVLLNPVAMDSIPVPKTFKTQPVQ